MNRPHNPYIDFKNGVISAKEYVEQAYLGDVFKGEVCEYNLFYAYEVEPYNVQVLRKIIPQTTYDPERIMISFFDMNQEKCIITFNINQYPDLKDIKFGSLKFLKYLISHVGAVNFQYDYLRTIHYVEEKKKAMKKNKRKR